MKLLLKEVQDRYVRENFKKIQESISALEGRSGGDTVTNNITQRIPLDGSEPISGTIEPDEASTHSIGSETKPLAGVHTDELYLSGNTLYINGKPAINYENNRVTFSSEVNQDVEVKARGTGKLIIASEGPIEINSVGPVTVNGSVIAAYSFGEHIVDLPSGLNGDGDLVIPHIPIAKTDRVILNGIELSRSSDTVIRDYTISDNVITFESGVLTATGTIKVTYSF